MLAHLTADYVPQISSSFAVLAEIFLFRMNFDLLVLDIQTEMVVDTHVLVGHPDESKKSDQVSAPVVVEQFEAGEDQKGRRDVMAKTVFTSKQIEKLAAA